MDEILKIKLLEQIPRILSQFDRNQNSATYGCGDRYYWKYKMHDYLNIRFQEAAYLFTLLYLNDFDGNIYYGNKNVRQLITAIISYWCKAQRNNGSFDENYPHESSFIATAFSLFTITESLLLLKINGNDFIKKTLLKAGKWLIKNNNYQVSNQIAASAAALNDLYLLFNNKQYLWAANKKIEWLKKEFEKYGFFPEYNGYDIGYSTIGLYFLIKTKNRFDGNNPYSNFIDKSAIRIIDKIAEEVDEFGNYDCSGKSRKTQYLFPYCFKHYGSNVFIKIINGLSKNKILQPSWMDDRFCIFFTINYLDTYLINK